MRRYRLAVAASVVATAFVLTLGSSPAGALPDPGAAGAYSVTTGFYDYGDTAFSVPSDSVNTFVTGVEVRAEVDYPTNIGSLGSLPLVLIMHGDHVACYDGSNTYNAWPCSSPSDAIPSYRGFHYLASSLASDGFIVVSISTNGIEVQEGAHSTDGGLLARAELAEYHLGLFDNWNVSSTGPFGSTFVGHVDLADVGLIGHSRGGGAAAKLVAYNQSIGSPYGIKALQLLSPYLDQPDVSALSGVAVNVMESYCDGNSVPAGVGYTDQLRYPGSSAPHSIIWAMGGNHYYWDTVQTPTPYPPGLPPIQDDWSTLNAGAYASDPWCGSSSDRLTPSGQQAVASSYTRAFFRWQLLGDTVFRPYFTGETTPPPSVGGADLLVNWVPPGIPGDRLDVNSFSSSSSLSTDDLGAAVTTSGSVTACGPPGLCASGSTSAQQEPHTYWGGVGQALVQWNAPGTMIDNAFDGTRDLSGGSIVLRAGVDFGTSQGTPDFDVTVHDDQGHVASVPVSLSPQPLFFPPGTSIPVVPRETLQTINIPLSDFSGIRVDRVDAIELDFDRTSSGSVMVADLMVADTTAALVPTFTIPPLILWLLPQSPLPHLPVVARVKVPLSNPGPPVESVSTNAPFSARLVDAGPNGCSANCVADVSFAQAAGTGPGEFLGTLTFNYSDGTTKSEPLVGHISANIPPACRVTSAHATLAIPLHATVGTTKTDHLTVSGSLGGCLGTLATRRPVTHASFTITSGLAPGATCASLAQPTLQSSAATITWKGVSSTGSSVNLETQRTTLAGLTLLSDPASELDLETAAAPSTAGPFSGTRTELKLVNATDIQAVATQCSTAGLSTLQFSTASQSVTR